MATWRLDYCNALWRAELKSNRRARRACVCACNGWPLIGCRSRVAAAAAAPSNDYVSDRYVRDVIILAHVTTLLWQRRVAAATDGGCYGCCYGNPGVSAARVSSLSSNIDHFGRTCWFHPTQDYMNTASVLAFWLLRCLRRLRVGKVRKGVALRVRWLHRSLWSYSQDARYMSIDQVCSKASSARAPDITYVTQIAGHRPHERLARNYRCQYA